MESQDTYQLVECIPQSIDVFQGHILGNEIHEQALQFGDLGKRAQSSQDKLGLFRGLWDCGHLQPLVL